MKKNEYDQEIPESQTNPWHHEKETLEYRQTKIQIWASTRQNLSCGFLTKRDSNQSPQLQRFARKLKFRLLASLDMICSKMRITKALKSLSGWAGWSAPLLFANPKDRFSLLGRVAQSVTCLATDACQTADPGAASSIPARSHTFVEIDHEIISAVILLLQLIHSRRVVVSYKRKYVHKLLVNRLFKPAQEKVCLGELTVPQ